jgi:hypothetical protein
MGTTIPTIGIVAPRFSRQRGDQRPRSGHQLLYNALGNQETMTKTTTETTLHRMASELPSCLQCRHDRHSSTMSCHATTWPQDRDENHARTCPTRRHSLQAKLGRPSIRLSTPRSGEPIALYTPWPRTLYKGSQGTHLYMIHILYHFHSFSIVAGLLSFPSGSQSPSSSSPSPFTILVLPL